MAETLENFIRALANHLVICRSLMMLKFLNRCWLRKIFINLVSIYQLPAVEAKAWLINSRVILFCTWYIGVASGHIDAPALTILAQC